jgi:hypothetical protein
MWRWDGEAGAVGLEEGGFRREGRVVLEREARPRKGMKSPLDLGHRSTRRGGFFFVTSVGEFDVDR